MNTKDSCMARVVVFREKGKFMAVCLDFNIIEEHDSYCKADESIREAAKCYYDSVVENNLSDEHLNKLADNRYWQLFVKTQNQLTQEIVKTKKQIGTYSVPLALCH